MIICSNHWTDHKNLQHLHTTKRLNSRQARWALLFTWFNFSLSYRPGSKNIKLEALSRRYSPMAITPEPETILPLVSGNGTQLGYRETGPGGTAFPA